MGSVFLMDIINFINNKRMEIFQAMFHKLYENYKGDLDGFIKNWFVEYSYGKLRIYFKEDVFRDDFELFYRKRINTIKAYIKAYWSYCSNPYKKPSSIKEAMLFFDLETLDEKELKKRYRSMVKMYHPDTNPDKKLANERLKEINHNYQMLVAYITKLKKEAFYDG